MMHFRWFAIPLTLATSLTFRIAAEAQVLRKQFDTPTGNLTLEVLDDDLIRVEISPPGSVTEAIATSPMVFKTDYSGPTSVTELGNAIETPELRVEINETTLCLTLLDKTQNAELTTLCPQNLTEDFKGFNLEPGQIQQVYGLGQQFNIEGSADGDWTALGVREGGDFGNTFEFFDGGVVGNVQIPLMYALGEDNLNYALFLDNVYKQRWDFTASPWEVEMFGDRIRFYIMTGADLPDLRSDYMELTGRPPVPPRRAFGLWVSEFGYDNWGQIDTLLAGLRDRNFPVDGFVLDLNWFGGIAPNEPARSTMGRLDWDENQDPLVADDRYFFPNPAGKIQEYAADGIRLAAIEESYLANATDTFREIPPNLVAYQRRNGTCNPNFQSNPIELQAVDFWGIGSMLDWSDSATGDWIHDRRRFPNLVSLGINVHWTDLGEPERFDAAACYEGVALGKNEHADIHNLYNLLWNRSIWQGYVENAGETDNLGVTNPRPFTLTRSGTAGTQRYGTAMWSGDIAARLSSLATHFNAQMHMSLAGIDYYGSDIGGFRKEAMPENDRQGNYRGYEGEMYTQWFANSAWFDVPVRPHTDNEFVAVSPPYATSPHLVGKADSNLANLQQRYELIPYYYSLAYRAHLLGEPVVSPPVFYYQNDLEVRQMGHQKLIGRDLMVGIVARHGEYERDMYLPEGRWIDYYTHEWIESSGETVANVPAYREGVFRLPAFVRAGAIVPMMVVDENTKDAFGNRKDGTRPEELRVRVWADEAASSFTLYEDDGETLEYDGDRPSYNYRTTELTQQQVEDTVRVTVEAAENVNGGFADGVEARSNLVELVVEDAAATGVSLNGSPLPQWNSVAELEAARRGWTNAGNNRILAKSQGILVDAPKTFTFELASVAATTSVNFVCDRGFTVPGESVYITGNLPELGEWNPERAIPLDPNVYYQYIVDGRGDSAPVWTGVVSELPPNTAFEWKCLRRREDDSEAVRWEPGENNRYTTGNAGYSGRSYGRF